MENYSPTESYRIVLMGDDLSHLTQLLADDRGLEDDCLACERIRRSVHLAEFHSLVDGPERAA